MIFSSPRVGCCIRANEITFPCEPFYCVIVYSTRLSISIYPTIYIYIYIYIYITNCFISVYIIVWSYIFWLAHISGNRWWVYFPMNTSWWDLVLRDLAWYHLGEYSWLCVCCWHQFLWVLSRPALRQHMSNIVTMYASLIYILLISQDQTSTVWLQKARNDDVTYKQVLHREILVTGECHSIIMWRGKSTVIWGFVYFIIICKLIVRCQFICTEPQDEITFL